MATVEKRIGKGGTSYRITVAGGLDENGKQVRIRRMWKPPRPDMTDRQIEKALSRAVADFEREIEQGYRLDRKGCSDIRLRGIAHRSGIYARKEHRAPVKQNDPRTSSFDFQHSFPSRKRNADPVQSRIQGNAAKGAEENT